ncbi:hypothetical protein [Streptococcus equi]|uniref:hypothetical protein n=1 Tax=Streptococcus equi TaxID=1336 RepID=UPI001E3C0CC2|nr:hypothetical protein [Streptococcus equi]
MGMTISKLKGEKHEKNNEEDAGSLDSLHHHVGQLYRRISQNPSRAVLWVE